MATLHIGFDDTDSPKGMCTTFLAYTTAGMLLKKGDVFLDFPRLVRFNPNIPWKTRGNGAVSMKISTDNPDRAKELVRDAVIRYSDTANGANPGLVFVEGDEIPPGFADLGRLALWQLVSRGSAKKLVQKNGLDHFFLGNGQGLVGAIGAIGYEFGDHTLELLAYRTKDMLGQERRISASSVKAMQEKTFPDTFGSIDDASGRVLIAPHGSDPVFYGIRGERADRLVLAAGMLESDERPVGHMIFKSNQGTGDHLRHDLDESTMTPYASGRITGTVSARPRVMRGGHVMFEVNSAGVEFGCAVYRPTGFSTAASHLIPGDKVCVGGGVRRASPNHPRTISLEFLHVQDLQTNTIPSNPRCPECSKRMKSKGRGQGFKCVRCGTTSARKEDAVIPRLIQCQTYTPIASARRHLTRPPERIGRCNTAPFDESASWFYSSNSGE